MLTAMLVTLREGLEAALVIAAILSLLVSTGEDSGKRFVWLGAAAAAALSLISGAILFLVLGSLPDEASETVEMVVALAAIGILTYMILWMRKHAAGIKGSLEQKTLAAVRAASPLALATLAFTAVGREGLETALFLFAGASSSGWMAAAAGGLTGLTLAAGTGFVLYRGSARLNLGALFNITGVLLIILAAGVLVNILGDFKELGLPGFLTDPVWNAAAFLSDEEGLGATLKSLFGYQSSPAPIQLFGYASYLTAMLWLYRRPAKRASAALAVTD